MLQTNFKFKQSEEISPQDSLQKLRELVEAIGKEELIEVRALRLNNEFRQAELERLLNPSNATQKLIENVPDSSVSIMQQAYHNIISEKPDLAISALEKLYRDSTSNFDQRGFFIGGQEELCLYLSSMAYQAMGENPNALSNLEAIYENRAKSKLIHIEKTDLSLLCSLAKLARLCGEVEKEKKYSSKLSNILGSYDFAEQDPNNKSAHFQIALNMLKNAKPDHQAIVDSLLKSLGNRIEHEHKSALRLLEHYSLPDSPIVPSSRETLSSLINAHKVENSKINSELKLPKVINTPKAISEFIEEIDSVRKETGDSILLTLLDAEKVYTHLKKINKDLVSVRQEINDLTKMKLIAPEFLKLDLEKLKVKRAAALVLLNKNNEALSETFNMAYNPPEGGTKEDTALARFIRAKAYSNLDLQQESEDEVLNVINLSDHYNELRLLSSSNRREWYDYKGANDALALGISSNSNHKNETISREEQYYEHPIVTMLRMPINLRSIKAKYESGMIHLKREEYEMALESFSNAANKVESKSEYSYGIASLKALIWLREKCPDENFHDAKEAIELKKRLSIFE